MTGRSITHQPMWSRCYAPSVSLYFTPRGEVVACCQNTTSVLGYVGRSTLEEIWTGPEIQAMRDSLAAGRFAEGCDFCAWQSVHGSGGVYADLFDEHPVQPDTAWPSLMEFAMSIRCNLECVMCNGDFSSAIRSRREHRPPLPNRYGPAFFEQLRPFLPHLRMTRFLGGEPFLASDYQRIWDLMVEEGARATVNVTTNGTIRSSRIESAMEALRFSIGVSVDGLTRPTIESIRLGADFDVLMANIAWFRRYCEQRRTGFTLVYCLMVPNHHEFLDFLRFAEDLGAAVAVNTVVYPPDLSLYRLPAHDLRAVVAAMEAQDASGLSVHAEVWEGELARLRSWAASTGRRGEDPDPEVAFFEAWEQPTFTPVELRAR